MKQEQCTHQRNDDKLLQQLATEVIYRAFYQGRAVIGLDDLDAVRQPLGQLRQLLLDALDGA